MSTSICPLSPFSSLSNPSSFFCFPDFCPFVLTARRHHIYSTPESLTSFYLRHLRKMLSIQPCPPPPISTYIFIYIYLLSLTLSFLSLSLILCLYLFILNLVVSRPLTHSLFLNDSFSHYLFYLYLVSYSLSHTHTLSDFTRASAPPIYVIPHDKINCGTVILLLATMNSIYRDDDICYILLARIRLDWLSSLTPTLSFDHLEILPFLKKTYH